MFEGTYKVFNIESVPSHISYKSFKTQNLPNAKFLLRSRKLCMITARSIFESGSLFLWSLESKFLDQNRIQYRNPLLISICSLISASFMVIFTVYSSVHTQLYSPLIIYSIYLIKCFPFCTCHLFLFDLLADPGSKLNTIFISIICAWDNLQGPVCQV